MGSTLIGRIRIVGKHVLFEQHLSPNLYAPIHVVNVETGKFGRFSQNVILAHDPLEIENKSILFELEDGEVVYFFEQIFSTIDHN